MKVICSAHEKCLLSEKVKAIDYCFHSVSHEKVEAADEFGDRVSCSCGCDVLNGIPGANCVPEENK